MKDQIKFRSRLFAATRKFSMEKREGCPMATIFFGNLIGPGNSYGIQGHAENSKPERGFDENPHERDVNCRCAGHASRAIANLGMATPLRFLYGCLFSQLRNLPTVWLARSARARQFFFRRLPMSSKASVVTSAADCCGRPQPIRSAGSSRRSKMEQKQFKTFASGLSHSRVWSLTAAALAGLVAIAGTASANEIINGNFSENAAAYTSYPGYSTSPNPSGPTGWNGHVTFGVNGPDTGFYGPGYLPFGPSPDTTINGGIPDFAFAQGSGSSISQIVATIPGQSYVLNYYGAAPAGQQDNMEVLLTDAIGGTTITSQTPSITDSKWTGFTMDFTAPSASTNVEFLNNDPSGSSNTVDVTDVAMTPVPEPAAVGLFALGGLGMLLISRKRAAGRSA